MSGLSGLHTMTLPTLDAACLERAASESVGPAPWRARLRAEAADLLKLALLSPRLSVLQLDLSTDLRALLELHVPVPTRAGPDAPLVMADRALLGLTWQREVLSEPRPGWSFVALLQPALAWHANVSAVRPGFPQQRLCLGASLPAGIPVREVVLSTWAALSMQSVQLDESDPAGVMNGPAARWWQQHPQLMPLTRATFLSDPARDDGSAGSTGEGDRP